MGCGQSKLEPDEEAAAMAAAAAAGKRPSSTGRRIFQDIRRRKAGRESQKGSFISTRELMRPEESEAGNETPTAENRFVHKASSPSPVPKEADKENKEDNYDHPEQKMKKKKKKMEKDKKKKVEEVAAAAAEEEEEEELPGSPSFRFYFDGPAPKWMENESVDAAREDEDRGKGNEKNPEENGHDQNPNKESEREPEDDHEDRRFNVNLANGASEAYNSKMDR